MRHDALPFQDVVQAAQGFINDGRCEAAVRDPRVPTHIAAQGDQRVELAPLGIVQAEHVVQEPCLEESRKLHGTALCQALSRVYPALWQGGHRVDEGRVACKFKPGLHSYADEGLIVQCQDQATLTISGKL